MSFALILMMMLHDPSNCDLEKECRAGGYIPAHNCPTVDCSGTWVPAPEPKPVEVERIRIPKHQVSVDTDADRFVTGMYQWNPKNRRWSPRVGLTYLSGNRETYNLLLHNPRDVHWPKPMTLVCGDSDLRATVGVSFGWGER
jgi:hypothetical protein